MIYTLLDGLLSDRCLLCGRLLVLEKVKLRSKGSLGVSIQASRSSLGLIKICIVQEIDGE